MRFLLMFKVDRDNEDQAPACKAMPEMASFAAELKQAGTLISTEGLHPSARGAQIRLSGGKRSVMDGPFAEAKELVAGFALVEVASKGAAIDLAERFLNVAGGGAAEIREVI